MMKSILAAAFVLMATSAALAQMAGFNPGTVMANVYENLYATYGYNFSFGFSPPPSGHFRAAPHRHYAVRKIEADHSAGK